MRAKELQLGHGSGGRLTAELLESVFLPAYASPLLEVLNDQAVFSINGARLAFTTDSFVVKPLFFPGGDIGKLAVNGTVNDLAMGGARPLYLSASFVLEEGLPVAELRRIVASLAEAARRSPERCWCLPACSRTESACAAGRGGSATTSRRGRCRGDGHRSGPPCPQPATWV